MSEPTFSRWKKFWHKAIPVLGFALTIYTAFFPGWNPWVIDNVVTPLGERPPLLLGVLGTLIFGWIYREFVVWWSREGDWGAKIKELNAEHVEKVSELNAAHVDQIQALEAKVRDLTEEKTHLESKLANPHVDDQHCFDILLSQLVSDTGALSWLDQAKFSGRTWGERDLNKVKGLLDSSARIMFRDNDMKKALKGVRDALRGFVCGLGDHADSHIGYPTLGDSRTCIKHDESADAVADELLELSNAVLRARDRFVNVGKSKNFSLVALYTDPRPIRTGVFK